MRELGSPPEPTLTIVGGQPTRGAQPSTTTLPNGIEELLLRAADDDEVRERLADDRQACLQEVGIELAASERATLLSISDEALAAMVDAIGRVEAHRRRA